MSSGRTWRCRRPQRRAVRTPSVAAQRALSTESPPPPPRPPRMQATFARTGDALVAALVIFWTIPVTFISSLTSLQVASSLRAHAPRRAAVDWAIGASDTRGRPSASCGPR
jgi:hypothetical protein